MYIEIIKFGNDTPELKFSQIENVPHGTKSFGTFSKIICITCYAFNNDTYFLTKDERVTNNCLQALEWIEIFFVNLFFQ